MSKNYYITTKDIEFIFDHMPDAKIDRHCRDFRIHLSQSAMNLTPLFQTHEKFSSWRECSKFLNDFKSKIEIVDEYGVTYSIDEYIETMENDNKQYKSRMMTVYPDMQNRAEYHRDSDGFEWCDSEFE